MKRKELKIRLSRMQSKTYNLQVDLSRLIADLDTNEFKEIENSLGKKAVEWLKEENN